jgi:hypothetical protein
VREFLDELKASDPDDFAVVVAGLSKLRNRQYHWEPLSKAIGDGFLNSAMLANSIPAYLVLHEVSPDCCVARLRNKAQVIPARDLATARERVLLAEKGRKVKKTNFDRYLDRQLQDPAFCRPL